MARSGVRRALVDGVDALLSTGALLTVVGALVASWHSGSLILAQQLLANGDAASVVDLEGRWDALADSADAVGRPDVDVAGAPNADGHEAAFALRDADGTRRWVSFTYDPAASTVTERGYRTRSSAGVPSNDAIVIASFPRVAAFAATRKSVTDFILPIYGATVPSDAPVDLGFADVPAGNRLVQVDLTIGLQRATYLLGAQAAPFGDARVTAHQTPDPTVMSVSPGALAFANRESPAQTIGVNEPRYVGPFSGSACVDGASGATLATLTTAGTNGPSDSWNVTPVYAWGGACTITVADLVGHAQGVGISVGPDYGPLTIAPAAGSTIVFRFPGDTAAALTANEDYYNRGFTVTDGDVYGNAPCGGAVGINFTQQWVDATTGHETWTVSPNAEASCALTVRDDHGGAQTFWVRIYATPRYAIALSPNPAVVEPGGTAAWTAGSYLQNGGATYPGTASSIGVYLANGRGPGACGSWTPTDIEPSGTGFSAYVASGTCYVDVVDLVGDVATEQIGARSYVLSAAPTSLVADPNTWFTFQGFETESDPYGGGVTDVALNDGTGPCSNWTPVTWSGSGTTFYGRADAPGACGVDVIDQHGGRTHVAITVRAYGLTVSNANFSIKVGDTASFQIDEVDSPAGGNTSVALQNVSGPCSFSPNGLQASGTTFSITGNAAGTCTADAVDLWGNRQTVTVGVSAARGPITVAHWNVAPGTGTLFTSNDGSWSTTSPDQWWTVDESGYSGTFAIRTNPDTAGCADFLVGAGNSGGQYYVLDGATSPSWFSQPAGGGGGFAIHPSAADGSACDVVIADDMGLANTGDANHAVTFHLSVSGSPTSPPATPAPTPSSSGTLTVSPAAHQFTFSDAGSASVTLTVADPALTTGQNWTVSASTTPGSACAGVMYSYQYDTGSQDQNGNEVYAWMTYDFGRGDTYTSPIDSPTMYVTRPADGATCVLAFTDDAGGAASVTLSVTTRPPPPAAKSGKCADNSGNVNEGWIAGGVYGYQALTGNDGSQLFAVVGDENAKMACTAVVIEKYVSGSSPAVAGGRTTMGNLLANYQPSNGAGLAPGARWYCMPAFYHTDGNGCAWNSDAHWGNHYAYGYIWIDQTSLDWWETQLANKRLYVGGAYGDDNGFCVGGEAANTITKGSYQAFWLSQATQAYASALPAYVIYCT